METLVITTLPALLPSWKPIDLQQYQGHQSASSIHKTEGAKPIEVFCLNPYDQSVEEAMEALHSIRFE